MSIYEQSVLGSSRITIDSIKEIMDRFTTTVRTKTLVCHPKNYKKLKCVVDSIGQNPDLHLVHPYKIICNEYVPKSKSVKTGVILWADNEFVKYSDGPSKGSELSEEEYLQMCLYFGWATEEIIDVDVWFELDNNSFFDVIKADETLNYFNGKMESMFLKHISNKINYGIIKNFS